MINIDPQQFELFVSLFRGRTDVWARYWEKDGRSGYSPAYEFDWDEFMVHKNRGGSLKDFANKRLIPLTPDIIKKHLIGQLNNQIDALDPEQEALVREALRLASLTLDQNPKFEKNGNQSDNSANNRGTNV